VFKFAFTSLPVEPFNVAVIHSVFNIFTSLLLLPFTKQLEKLAKLIIKDSKKHPIEQYAVLDERLLLSPPIAISESKNVTENMARLSTETLLKSIELIGNISEFSDQRLEEITENESAVDKYEDELGTYLVKISGKELSGADSRMITRLLHSIGDYERISDHAINIIEAIKELNDKKLEFSGEAKQDLSIYTDAIREVLSITLDSFVNNDLKLAAKVEPLEQAIDDLCDIVKIRHIERLKQGLCTIEMGFILSDLLNNLERVSDHCSNIAVCLIELEHSSFDTHGYLNERKTSGEPVFEADYKMYREKYSL
jgi:phosphate:Na+ symporter